jgi:hypothetical protein
MKSKSLVIMMALLASLLSGAAGATAGQMAQTTKGDQPKPGPQVSPLTPLAPVGSGFTYQGRLVVSGSPASGNYDFTFTLFDAATGGNQVGSTITVLTQTLSVGTFTVVLNFLSNSFQGDARWLQIGVRPSGDPTFTVLSPRQAITAAPYALSLRPGAVINGASGGPTLSVTNTSGNGLNGSSTGSGSAGVYGSNVNGSGYGVYGYSSAASGTGVFGSAAGTGVLGTSTSGKGMYGTSTSGYGVYGATGGASPSAGVYGSSTAANGIGVQGVGDNGPQAKGVYGTSSDGWGVYGFSSGANGVGVRGVNDDLGAGVLGDGGFYGVYGTGFTGVYGFSVGGTGVYGSTGNVNGNYAGYFSGNVNVTGSCCAAGMGTSRLDDPLDPTNKYLTQALVESPDLKNIYDGNVTTDAKGEATVALPNYVEALNQDFRYQLTVVGQFAQAIVSSEINNNRFTIRTDKPNLKVSWQVTGIRHDPYAEHHPIQVEQEKTGAERGMYLYPKEYGQPENMGVDYQKNQTPKQPNPGLKP